MNRPESLARGVLSQKVLLACPGQTWPLPRLWGGSAEQLPEGVALSAR